MALLDYRMVSDKTQWSATAVSKTAASFDGIMADTTTSPVTITLPSNPAVGEHVSIRDAASTFATNNLTISGNGNNVDGAATLVLNTDNDSKIIVWSGSEWKSEAGAAGGAGGGGGAQLGEIIKTSKNSLDTMTYVDTSVHHVLNRSNFPGLSAITPASNSYQQILSGSMPDVVASNGAGVIVSASKTGAQYLTTFYKSIDGGKTSVAVFTDILRTQSASPNTDSFSICWDGTRFIAIRDHYNSTTIEYFSSADGTTWAYNKTTTTDLPALANNSVIFATGTKVFLSNTTGTSMLKSAADPIIGTFATITGTIPAYKHFYVFGSTIYAFPDYVLVASANYYKSVDSGVTWVSLPFNMPNTATGYLNGGFLAATTYGYFLPTSSGNILKSLDLVTWTHVATPIYTTSATNILFSFNDVLYMATSMVNTSHIDYVTNSGRWAGVSADGTTWTESYPGYNIYWGNSFLPLSNYPLVTDLLFQRATHPAHDPITQIYTPKTNPEWVPSGASTHSQKTTTIINAMRVL